MTLLLLALLRKKLKQKTNSGKLVGFSFSLNFNPKTCVFDKFRVFLKNKKLIILGAKEEEDLD